MKITKDTADKIEKFGYMRKFTADELQQMKENLSNESIEKNDLELELKEIAKDLNDKIKGKKKSIKVILHNLKHKAEYVNEECCVELDNVSGYAIYFSAETGEEVGRRPLTPEERQTTIFTESRKAM